MRSDPTCNGYTLHIRRLVVSLMAFEPHSIAHKG